MQLVAKRLIPEKIVKMQGKRVYAVAMSGGVDSSVVAAILQRDGHEVFGITMDIHSNCTQDIEDARAVSRLLGIEHITYDVRAEYKAKVIDLFVRYYEQGLTPNPCSFCNRDLKLNMLVDFAKGKGADFLATGHYAHLAVNGDDVILSEGANLAKDQSYFVSLAPRDKLVSVRFPLENISDKSETRTMAQRFGLPNFKKDDSQDICFIRGGDYKEFLRDVKAELFERGYIRNHETGEIVGEHHGIVNYTVGQRRGLGISGKNQLYVIKLDPAANEVFVGPEGLLDVRKFSIIDVNWILDVEQEFEAFVKVRSFGQKSAARLAKINSDEVLVELCEKSNSPVTSGQVCVVYNEQNQVVCAGIIRKY